MKVLIVDDEGPIRLLCRVNLEPEGVHVLEAPDGSSGLEAARTELPDVILLDVMLPSMDGIGVAGALRSDEQTRGIPICFLSPRVEFCECVNELGFHDIVALAEPFNPLRLAGIVERLVEATGTQSPTSGDALKALWALRSIAVTPNTISVSEAVAEWRRVRLPAHNVSPLPQHRRRRGRGKWPR